MTDPGPIRGLSTVSSQLLHALVRAVLEHRSEPSGLPRFERQTLTRWAADAGVREEAMVIAVAELHGAEFVRPAVALGVPDFSFVRVTDLGLEAALPHQYPAYEAAKLAVAIEILDRELRYSPDIAAATDAPLPVVDHLLRVWAAGGRLILSEEIGAGERIAFVGDDGLERWVRAQRV